MSYLFDCSWESTYGREEESKESDKVSRQSGGNPIEVRKLKLLRTSLQTKCSELQVLDRDIVELLEDVSKIDSDVSESCELISVIQECMVDLESALTA